MPQAEGQDAESAHELRKLLQARRPAAESCLPEFPVGIAHLLISPGGQWRVWIVCRLNASLALSAQSIAETPAG
jgi:hypothetical protein